MKILYKYIKRENAESFFNNGTLRIGTLLEFRNEEKHGNKIGDNREGTKSVNLDTQSTPIKFHSKSQHEFTKKFFDFTGSDINVKIEGIKLKENIESTDYYLFCASDIFSEDIQKELKYDCCIKIHDSNGFLSALSESLKCYGSFKGIFKCIYNQRDVDYGNHNNIHPALIKDHSYSKQNECRALWMPLTKPIQPIMIQCPDAKQFCRM